MYSDIAGVAGYDFAVSSCPAPGRRPRKTPCFFEVIGEHEAWPCPGQAPDLANQPYYVLHADETTRSGRHGL